MINESGTMSGGGGKPRGGRMCLGKAALASVDTQAAAAELQAAEQELEHGAQVQCACQQGVFLAPDPVCFACCCLVPQAFGQYLIAVVHFCCCIYASTCM